MTIGNPAPTEKQTDELHIPWISINMSPDVGEKKGFLFGLRIVPDGREGMNVYARALRPDEPDDGQGVRFSPSKGEKMSFRNGSVQVTVAGVDRYYTQNRKRTRTTNTLWTWFKLTGAGTEEQVRYLVSGARRLDTARVLRNKTLSLLTRLDDLEGIELRDAIFEAMGTVESYIIALHRALQMTQRVAEHFSLVLPPPSILRAAANTEEIRHAFEHIDERALGKVRGEPDPKALSIFNFQRLLDDGVITYGRCSMNIGDESAEAIEIAHQYLVEACAALCGPARINHGEITFFDGK